MNGFPTRCRHFQTGTWEGTKELHMNVKAEEMLCPTCKFALKLFQAYHVYFLNKKEALVQPVLVD